MRAAQEISLLSGNRVWNFAALESGGGRGVALSVICLQKIADQFLLLSKHKLTLLPLLAFKIQVHIIIQSSLA